MQSPPFAILGEQAPQFEATTDQQHWIKETLFGKMPPKQSKRIRFCPISFIKINMLRRRR
jgi:hypothetical protein